MNVTIENLSPDRRKHWTTVSIPNRIKIGTHAHLRVNKGRAFRVVNGPSLGDERLIHVQADLAGHESVTGELVDEPINENPFVFHPWVVDSIEKLQIQVGVTTPNGLSWSDRIAAWKLLEMSDGKQRWWTRAFGPHGLIIEVWADVFSGDPVVDFFAKVVWSDRLDPQPNIMFDALWLRCGEMLSIDFSQRHGIVGGVKDSDGFYRYLLGTHMPFTDGSALPITGAMLCFKDAPDLLTMDEASESVQNLRAAANGSGPVIGIAQRKNGDWLARGVIAAPNVLALNQSAEQAWGQFAAMDGLRVGWFAPRPQGCSQTPGQTGSQDDFGATKGTFAVALNSPRHIYRMRYSVQADLFRGCQHYENGVPLFIENHPQWVTTSMVTHWHSGVSPDRLGKQPLISPSTGWFGYDAQHRSQNTLAAYITLSDDPMMLEHCNHMAVTDLADYRRRFPNNGPDSARGQGRPVGTWAQLLKVTKDVRYADLIIQQAKQSVDFMRLISGPSMKVLSWIPPDPRVQLYVDGTLAPSVSLWEHALAIVGYYLALKQPQQQLVNRAKEVGAMQWIDEIVRSLAELLADYAIVQNPDKSWTLCTSVHWNNGNEPLAAVVDNGSGVGGWVRAGLLVAREFLPSDHRCWSKLNSYWSQPVGPRGETLLSQLREEFDVGWAEWWAAVDLNA